MKCKKHPDYKAIKKPTCNCQKCWDIYRAKQLEKEYLETKVGRGTNTVKW